MGRLKGISLFTGAGGLDMGFEAAGVDPYACFEIEPNARETLKINRPDWVLADDGDVEKIRPGRLLQQLGLRPGDLDVMYGGPPCQPFSKAAFWARDTFDPLADARTRPLLHVNRLIQAALPRLIVLENVATAAGARGGAVSLFEKALARINKAEGTNYAVHIVQCNAADYGVPQLRERAFVIAYRDGAKLERISPTVAIDDRRTAWDAIGDISLEKTEAENLRLRGKWADLLPSIPEGGNYLHHTDRGDGEPLFGWRTRYWSFLLKLAKDKPAWTVSASPGPATGPFHWDNRNLSIAELKRIQTFPDNYRLFGTYAMQRRQLGNAVPPALAEAVARKAISLLGQEEAFAESRFIQPRRHDSPAPHPVQPVDAKYLALRADHPAHPGHGQGPGAKKRAA